MYLSKLTLNPRHPQARLDAANCHELHRTLLSAFPADVQKASGGLEARSQFGLLYRIEAVAQGG